MVPTNPGKLNMWIHCIQKLFLWGYIVSRTSSHGSTCYAWLLPVWVQHIEDCIPWVNNKYMPASHVCKNRQDCFPCMYCMFRTPSHASTWYSGRISKTQGIYGTRYLCLFPRWVHHIQNVCIIYLGLIPMGTHGIQDCFLWQWMTSWTLVRPAHDIHTCFPVWFMIPRTAFIQYTVLPPVCIQQILGSLSCGYRIFWPLNWRWGS